MRIERALNRMAGGREEIAERQQRGTIDEESLPGKIGEIENPGRGSGGRRGTLALAALPGFGKILGQSEKSEKEAAGGGRGGRRATLYDISAFGTAFANLRGINSATLALGDQKVTTYSPTTRIRNSCTSWSQKMPMANYDISGTKRYIIDPRLEKKLKI